MLGKKEFTTFFLFSSFHYSNIPATHVVLGKIIVYEILKFQSRK